MVLPLCAEQKRFDIDGFALVRMKKRLPTMREAFVRMTWVKKLRG
jgi:hypothetical protein